MKQELNIELINAEDLLKQAQSLIQKEKWHDAITLLSQSQQITDKSIECLNILAYCYSKNKNYTKASNIYEELCNRQPHKAKWLYYLAYQYRSEGDLKAAIKTYEKCLELSPQWLKVYLELGQIYEEIGSTDKAIKVYREGITVYKEITLDRQKDLSHIYSKLCTRTGKLLLSYDKAQGKNSNEIEFLFKESTIVEQENADVWYRLGNFLLETERVDEALEYLKKAKSLAPNKEYIHHKIAQAHLKKGNIDLSLKIYESIPNHKKTAYILQGIAECLLRQGKTIEGVHYLFKAMQKEPGKFYLHRDLGLALITLGDRDQAIEELKKANELYKKDNGKDFNKILAKIEEIRNMPQGKRIVFEEPTSSIISISYGVVIKYNSERGFGFIKDDNDGQDVFFHISSIKNRIEPTKGMRGKFIRERGEKGPQASKVWLRNTSSNI